MKNACTYQYPLRISKTEYPTFQERLKIAMKLRNFTVSKLAQKTYLSQSTIMGYRNGSRSPSLEILNLICDALDVTTDFLLGRSEYLYIENLYSNDL